MAKTTASPPYKQKQRSVRFAPDPNTMVQVNFDFAGKKTATSVGLVLNESRTGFAAVFNTPLKIKEGMDCVCQVGELPNTPAVVRWIIVLEEQITKIGFEYSL